MTNNNALDLPVKLSGRRPASVWRWKYKRTDKKCAELQKARIWGDDHFRGRDYSCGRVSADELSLLK